MADKQILTNQEFDLSWSAVKADGSPGPLDKDPVVEFIGSVSGVVAVPPFSAVVQSSDTLGAGTVRVTGQSLGTSFTSEFTVEVMPREQPATSFQFTAGDARDRV